MSDTKLNSTGYQADDNANAGSRMKATWYEQKGELDDNKEFIDQKDLSENSYSYIFLYNRDGGWFSRMGK